MTTAAPKSPWGNPKSSAFRKMHIRQVTFEGATAEVHAEVLGLAAEVFRMAAEQDVLPKGAVASFDPELKGTNSPFAYGVAMVLPGVDGAEAWGWVERDGALFFGGDIEDARRLTALAEEIAAERSFPKDIIHEDEQAWAHTRPGQRVLRGGMRGDDVQFIQTLLQAPDQGGVYGGSTEYVVRLMQAKNGLPETGVVDLATWLLMYPRSSTFGLGRGDTGPAVRVAQALLVAYGWDEALEITGRYGVATDKAIRRLQEKLGIRLSGYMRGAEWVALLGPQNEWPTRDTILADPSAAPLDSAA